MFNCKYLMGFLCAFSLVATVPNAPAKAGSNGGAVAAGIAGAVGAAIIMNQLRQGARPNVGVRRHASRSRAARPKNESG